MPPTTSELDRTSDALVDDLIGIVRSHAGDYDRIAYALRCRLLRAQPAAPLTGNERALFEKLSTLVSGGNAGTWEELLHAIEQRLAQPKVLATRHWLPPTCATCRHWQELDDPHHRYWRNLGGDDTWRVCRAPDFPSDGTWTPPTFGCTLFEPVPASPASPEEQ